MAESEWVQMMAGVKRRIKADGEKLMLVEVRFEAGAAVPAHSHPHEQISYVVSGRFEFTVDGKAVIVAAGESLHLPSNVPHAARALEASTALDAFSPPREDFRKQ
ncbi:MAG: cupin domain-containing protein [Chloroflexi bacterium]|nr:cupin domain-containing protein [Chloroflexota bacterium]